MRYLLLSDVHANATALTEVLKHADAKRWQQVIFLGDAVGYYPQPEAVITALQTLPLKAALLGNHDELLLEPTLGGGWKGVVLDVLDKQRAHLNGRAHSFLAQLTRHAAGDSWEAVHSTLAGSWDYVDSLERAQLELPRMSRLLLFFGHTHVPIIYLFAEQGGKKLARSLPLTKDKTLYRLPPNARVLFNPGSVGQPRDGIPLASYGIYDEDAQTLEHYRVAFDVAAVQRLVKEADYPASLATRLGRGR